jgi:hypothetical protein
MLYNYFLSLGVGNLELIFQLVSSLKEINHQMAVRPDKTFRKILFLNLLVGTSLVKKVLYFLIVVSKNNFRTGLNSHAGAGAKTCLATSLTES